MKKLLITMLITLSLLMTIGCSEDSNNSNTTESTNQQFVVAWFTTGLDFVTWVEGDRFEALVTGTPFPTRDHFKINYFYYDKPENFIRDIDGLHMIVNSDDTFQLNGYANVEIVTDVGLLQGIQTQPDVVTNLKVNGEDPEFDYTINENDSLSVSWDYGVSKPDFVKIEVNYRENLDGFPVNNPKYIHYSPNTETSRTIFETGILREGWIDIRITAVNGPNPDTNPVGNLSGDGVGYIYWENIAGDCNMYIGVAGGIKTVEIPDDDSIEIFAPPQDNGYLLKDLEEKLNHYR